MLLLMSQETRLERSLGLGLGLGLGLQLGQLEVGPGGGVGWRPYIDFLSVQPYTNPTQTGLRIITLALTLTV